MCDSMVSKEQQFRADFTNSTNKKAIRFVSEPNKNQESKKGRKKKLAFVD